jgi:hypothetical protein
MNRTTRMLTLGALLLAAACGSSAGPPDDVTLDALAPAPGATGVSLSPSISLTYSAPMAAGMEQYLDLHEGGITGPIVPMTCGWNGARTGLTCTPDAPLAAATGYLIHMGGGMHAQSGHGMDLDPWTSMGGSWMMSGMMGGMHGGGPLNMMGSGWRHGSDYGMGFGFTTL